MQNYEMVLVLRPTIADEEIQSPLDNISKLITSKGGVIDKIEPWGRKKMSYPVKRFSEGNYFLAQFKLDPKMVKEVEKPLLISSDVIRHLVVRLDS